MRPRPRGSVLAVFAIWAMSAALPALAHDADPAKTVRTFLARYAAGDLRGASEMWVAGAPADGFIAQYGVRLEKRCLQVQSLTIAVVTNDPAVIEATSTMIVRGSRPGASEWWESSRSRFTLERDRSAWRIAGWEPAERALIDRIALAADPAAGLRLLADSPELHTTTFARLASRRAIDLVNLNRLAAADVVLAAAAAVAETLGDPSSIAETLTARSIVLRLGGSVAQSLVAAEEATELALAGGDPQVIAGALVRLGRTREVAGIPDAEPFERALTYIDGLEDVAIAAHAAVHLGRFHESRGNYREAFRLAVLGSRLAEESGDPSARLSASTLLAGAYVWIGDHALSGRHSRRAVEIGSAAGFVNSTALGIVGMASAAFRRGQIDEGLRILNEHVEKYKGNAFMERTLRNARFGLLFGRGEIAAAERDANWLASLLGPDEPAYADLEMMRGLLARERGDHHAALAYFEAARGLRPAWDGTAGYLVAEVLADCGRIAEARDILEAMDGQGEALQIVDPGLSLFHPRTRSDRRLLLEIVAGNGEHAYALEIAEKLKASELRNLLTHGREEPAAGEANREKWYDALEPLIDNRIRELNRRLVAGERNPAELAAIRAQLTEARTDLIELRQFRYANHAQSAAVWAPVEMQVDDLPAEFDDTAIVSYAVGPNRTTAIVVAPKRDGQRKITARVLAIGDAALRRKVSRLTDLVSQRNLRVPVAGAEMYDLLVAPLQPVIGAARALCIVPDSWLWRVPFHALGPRDGPLLVERMPVFYAPSIAVLAAAESMRVERAGEKPRLLAFANPSVSAETASLYRAFDADAPLGAIPETESEVRAIGRIYGREARIYIGNAAREATLKREAGHYDVIHIATHGVLSQKAPMFSSLLLSAAPDDRSEDGLLEAREIADLALNADLAVLSACETGRADDVNGEGLIALSWAFLAAGCPTTVVSQWKAQSAATAMLMVDFHRHLARGLSKPEALRRAQLTLRRDRRYRHPFYWAPFVVIGMP